MTTLHHRAIRAADADAIVIGAGINGLICATLLAQARLRVLILEARERPGGLCATSEIIPGFLAPLYTPWTGPLDAGLVRQLKLQKFGLDAQPQRLSAIALSPDGHHLALDPHSRRGSGALAQHSPADTKTFPAFDAAMRKLAAGLGSYFSDPPLKAVGKQQPAARVRLDDGLRSALAGLALKPMSSLLEEYLESPVLQGALALEATAGTGMGPETPGSAIAWLEKLALETVRPDTAVWFQGGPGALSHALSQAAQSSGASLRVNARVAQLIAHYGRAEGVVLDNGDAIYAPIVVSSLSPAQVLNWPSVKRAAQPGLDRIAPNEAPAHGLAKVHLALRGAPQFKGLDAKDLRARILISGSLGDVSSAYEAATRGALHDAPPMEAFFPTAMDGSLAPKGGHVVSLTIPFAPLDPHGGWAAAKAQLTLSAIATLERYAPDLPNRVLAAEAETPEMLARAGATLLWRQVHPSGSDPQNPYGCALEGLFFCGAGTHPRAGATGLNGRNCAEAILALHAAGGEPV